LRGAKYFYDGISGINMLIFYIVLFLVLVIFINITLSFIDKINLCAPGNIVEVKNHKYHVYTVGKNGINPTIILLSGSGEPSPVYNYKMLYSRISGSNKVIVLEKFGYGYSDITGLKRDIEDILEEDREALLKANVRPPYVLMPHSMSCLEALVWANKYKNEVVGIIGLDMAFPKMYESNNNYRKIVLNKIFILFGLHRIRFFYKLNTCDLNKAEIKQQKKIVGAKTLNKDIMNECRLVYDNAIKADKYPLPIIPVLQFSSSISTDWIDIQKEYASKMKDNKLVLLDCGHYLHYTKNDVLVKEILEFLQKKINLTTGST
jgi:pimeloyl-ACP methyl ester carboxylesterase